MPDLVSRSDRSAMLLALLKAGAHRPLASRDAWLQKLMGKQAQDAFDKAKTPQAKAKSLSDLIAAQHLVAADYELWAPLVQMTEGTAVLDAFLRLGTSPPAANGDENLLLRAAFAGNADAVAWLQKRLPRHYDYDASENLGEADRAQATPPQRDAWGEAATWALDSPFTVQRLAIFKMLARGDTDWASRGSDRSENNYRARLDVYKRTPAFGDSLLARVVATGDAALLEIALSLNAVRSSDAAFEAKKIGRDPDAETGSASGDALVQALLMQRADLLQRLLAAGASPLAWASGQTTPLVVAVNRKAADRYGDRKPLPAEDHTFYAATLNSFLKLLTPAQIRANDIAERSPLTSALDSNDDAQDPGLINKLIAAGFSPGKLELHHLGQAIRNGNSVLALAMLDGGIANPPVTGETEIEQLKYEEKFSYLVQWAAFYDQRVVLDRLLALRKPSATLSAAELGLMSRLADAGQVDIMKLLQSRGWVVDRAMNQLGAWAAEGFQNDQLKFDLSELCRSDLFDAAKGSSTPEIATFRCANFLPPTLLALNSMQVAVIDFVLEATNSTLAGLCIFSGESRLIFPPLVSAISELDDAAWQQLLALGVARLPSCAAGPSEERFAPSQDAASKKTSVPLPMTMVAKSVLSDPFAVSGFRKESLPARIAQLRQQGMQKADFGDNGAGPLLRRAAGEAALQPVLAALEAPTPVKAPADGATSRPARLVGNYQLGAGSEAPASLQLKVDGRFELSVSYGASDRYAQGQWHEAGGKVVFASDPTPPFNWFKVTSQTQYDDGPDTGQPLTLLADVGKSRLSHDIQTLVQAGVDEIRGLRLEPNIGSTFTLKGQPRSAALWFPLMKAVLASEVALPDLPRLKSVTLTLQLPQQALTMPFNEVMRANAEGLHQGNSVYKKSK